MTLKGRRALVTGGARRIGRAIALALAEEGCDIALHYGSSAQDAKATAAEIMALGVGCTLHKADLSRSTAVLALAKSVLKHKKGCDILVNSASIFPKVALDQARPADFDAPYAVNLRAPALLTQALGLALVKAKKHGHIINIADTAALHGLDGYLPYSLSKAGLLQLTRASAAALAPWVLVNSVSPGSMLMPDKHSQAHRRQSEERSLLKRLGTPEDVAGAVVFIAHSNFMTGSDLKVDGGRELLG